MSKHFVASIAATFLLYSLSPAEIAEAKSLDRRLIGAWAQSASDCKDVFETRKGRATFRQPVNTLITAFIIGAREIVATTGQCRIGRVVAKDGHFVASLSCSNSIGFAPISARLKVVSENEIVYGSTDDPLMDSSYVRCQ